MEGDRRDGVLGTVLDVFRVKQYLDSITTARELVPALAADAELLDAMRRAMLPLPFEGPGAVPGDPFPPFRRADLRLPWRRTGIVATGGSGAMAALVGVLRACEESGVTPSVISLASGAALFGFPFGAGRSATAVAEFVLSLGPRDYVDVDWPAILGLLPHLGRGFAGIIRGERLEHAYREFLGDLRLGDMAVPVYAPIWNIDENRVEYLGPRTRPDMRVATAVRLAVSLPLFVDPQPLDGSYWGDGAVVEILPVHPALDIEEPPDAALVLNCFYPPGFEGEDAHGWRERRLSVIHAASQVRTAQQAQLARENLARLRREVPNVMLLEPVPYTLVKGGRFYLQFLDNSRWPGFMRAGRRDALAALKRAARRPAAAARAS